MCHPQEWVVKGLERPQRLSCPHPATDRQQDVGIAAFCCSQQQVSVPSRPGDRFIPCRQHLCPGALCPALPWDTTPSHGALSPCPGSS